MSPLSEGHQRGSGAARLGEGGACRVCPARRGSVGGGGSVGGLPPVKKFNL